MKKIIVVILLVVSIIYLFTFNIFAIDATSEWNAIDVIMMGEDKNEISEQPIYSTVLEISGGSSFHVSIPLAGDDWQIDPTQAFEVRFMLMMVSGTNNYNSGSKKLNKAYFSTFVQGSNGPTQIASSDFTEYSYAVAFDPAVRLSTDSYFPISSGLPTDYVSDAKGIYTGRGYFFDVVVNANAFTGATPKSIQFDVTRFTSQTGASTYIFCPYVAVRNIIPTEKDYLVEILNAIQNLQSNGGMSADEMETAVISALETYEQANQEKFGGEAENIADDIIGEYLPDRATLENAVGQLNDALSYSGTDCVITFPAISILGYTLSNSIEVNLTQYLDTFFSQGNLSVLLNFIRVFVTLGMSVAVIKMYFDFFTSLLSGEWKAEKYLDKMETDSNTKLR